MNIFKQQTSKKSLFFMVVVLGLASACSRDSIPDHEAKTPIVPPITGERKNDTAIIPQTGHQIALHRVGATQMFEVEAVLTDDSFVRVNQELSLLDPADRKEAFSAHLARVANQFGKAKAIITSRNDELGYFTMLLPYSDDLFGAVKDLETESRVILNPVIFDPEAIKAAKAFRPGREDLKLKTLGARDSSEAYSGLQSIGAIDFVKTVEAELGGAVKVDGSSVRLGVTDTGITYNHPTFLSSTGRNRIVYMKDFTGEGFAYFHPTAKFSAKPGATQADLEITAEVLPTPKLPARPSAARLVSTTAKVRVSPELKALLLDPATVARYGYVDEAVLQAGDEAVDINANGKLNDKLGIILVMGATAADDRVYFDPSGTGDFRKSRPMGDWNLTGDTVEVFAEKFGFGIAVAAVPAGADMDTTVDVRSVSIVGFDPGNHGSHVAGIAGGLKTIANDDDKTLARGVAPEAALVIGRVCSNNAGCSATAALTDLAKNGKAEVINMSLGGLGPFNDGYGVQETVINRLSAVNNVLFVISAGNSGPGRQTVGSPSVARRSLSVGATANRAMIQRQYQWPGAGTSPLAVEDSDFMLFFSSRGPTAAGGFKPNVAAPGTELSAIQLNSAPGSRGGLDVFWGTSMSAPTATGAYALLLDAVKKFNAANPSAPLTTNAMTLREILIQSARPFDVKTLDPASAKKTDGQYTWVDQGAGMVNLPAAWALLKAHRDTVVPSAVTLNGAPVELDYQVLVSGKSPTGVAYDGTRPVDGGIPPVFGTGLYLDFRGKETLKQVYIARRIPESFSGSSELGALTRQLVTTRDEFVLKTVVHGSTVEWLKAGTGDMLPCWTSPVANLSLVGRAVDLAIERDGTATLNAAPASNLNVCLDRQAMSRDLPPGDHGALIYGYRTAGGKTSVIPSFVIPVYLSVPHQVLANNKGYKIDSSVKSFGISRNYVYVPEGTSMVRVSLEVAPAKLDANGNAIPETCAGVELMALDGANTAKVFDDRLSARAQNCESNGSPAPARKHVVTFTRTNPRAGVWDLHVFGQYRFVNSPYTLRVDYVTGESSVKKIEGGLPALTGAFEWTLKEASSAVAPDSAKSTLELTGLRSTVDASVKNGDTVVVTGALGMMRTYPVGVNAVRLTTGSSPGNDLDMFVVECPAGLAAPDETQCNVVGQSGGPADDEQVVFIPESTKTYAMYVQGYAVKDAGKFKSTETLVMKSERGVIDVKGAAPVFKIGYGFDPAAMASSPMINHPLFTSGKFRLAGTLTLKTADEAVLDSLSVDIGQ